MSLVIQGWMRDEYERLKSVLPDYEKKLEAFPNGSLVIRKQGREEYAYHQYRVNGKMKSEYIGSVFSLKYFEMKKSIDSRNSIIKEIREMKEQIADLELILRILVRREEARRCRRNKAKKKDLNCLLAS